MVDTRIARCGTVGVLRPFLTRCRRFVVAIVALSIVSAVVVTDAQTPLDQERVQRARQFLSRFMESPCLNNERCQSWLGENKLGGEDVARALREMDQALGDTGRLRDQIARLEATVRSLEGDRRQTEQDAEAMRQRLASLTRDAVDRALAVLGEHHFGLQARSPADLLSQQLQEPTARFQCGDQQVIITVFGYFIHDHEIDLTKGEKKFKLVFQPFVFARGGSLGQAIDEYTKKAQLSLGPRLGIAARSIEITPTSQPPKLLQPASSVEWLWDLKQPWWSSVTETDGTVTIRVASPDRAQDVPSLMVKVKGSPWWWPLAWLWEKVLSKVETWSVGAVVAVIAWRKGLVAALRWLWEWVKRKAGDDQAGGKK